MADAVSAELRARVLFLCTRVLALTALEATH